MSVKIKIGIEKHDSTDLSYVELSVEEAREVYMELQQFFGGQGAAPQPGPYVPHWWRPVSPGTPWQPWQPIITC